MSGLESNNKREISSVDAATSTSISILNPTFTGPQPKAKGVSPQPTLAKASGKDGKTATNDSPIFYSPNPSDEKLPHQDPSLGIVSEVRSGASQSLAKHHVKDETDTASAAILLVSHHTSISEESLSGRNKKELLENENGWDSPTEKSPLLKTGAYSDPVPEYNHTRAYEKHGSTPAALDPEDPASKKGQRHKSDEEQDAWWCWFCCRKKASHPITSQFTNEAFRQEYAGEIFKIKATQILLCFLVSITSQSFWGWDWNVRMGTPAYVLRVEEHRWVTAIPLCLYVIEIGFIRLVTPQESRSWPFNMIYHIASTVLLCLLSFMLSVGFGDVFYSGLVPVTLGSLCFAQFIFRRLVIAEWDHKFRVDVSTRGFYYAIPTLISAGMIISWPIVFLILWVTGSAVEANENVGESVLWEGIPAIPIGGIILLIQVHHIKELFDGRLVSIITEDQSEVLFSTFFI